MATTQSKLLQSSDNASFRGVPFQVETKEEEGGRRVVIHEYPQRDTIYAEDMGKKARQIPVEAFVLGEDWLERRNALLEALEQKGPGTLVLPRRGTLRAICTGVRVRESMKERRIATFSLTFVEYSDPAYPSTDLSSIYQVRTRADSVQDIAARLLNSRFSLSGMPSFVSDNAVGDVSGLVSSAGLRRSVGDRGLFGESLGGLSGISASSLSGGNLSELLGPLYADAGTDLITDDSYQRTRYADFGSLATQQRPVRSARYATPARLQDVRNQQALYDYERRMSVAEMARSSSYISPRTTTEASSLRETVTLAIESLLLETDDDEAYGSLVDLRSSCVRDMTTRSRYAAVPRQVPAYRSRNALVLSGDYYGDYGYESEIATRNSARHPGFLEAGLLEVLDYVR